MTFWRADLITKRAVTSAAANRQRSAPLPAFVGFIDETAVHAARPGRGLLRACYSGRKRRQVLKIQSFWIPDGALFRKYGPHAEHCHDIVLYQASGLHNEMRLTLLIDGVQPYIFGEFACILRAWFQTCHGTGQNGSATRRPLASS